MALTYGTTGIKQKSFRVYIAAADTVGLTDTLNALIGSPVQDKLTDTLALMSELGECRDDSISVTGENGDSVEGNEVGEIILNKACAMSAELINCTMDNLDTLEALDGTPISVLLLEKDYRTISSVKYKTAIIIQNKNMSYSENITGGDSIRATVNIADSAATIGSFRSIVDCEVA